MFREEQKYQKELKMHEASVEVKPQEENTMVSSQPTEEVS